MTPEAVLLAFTLTLPSFGGPVDVTMRFPDMEGCRKAQKVVARYLGSKEPIGTCSPIPATTPPRR